MQKIYNVDRASMHDHVGLRYGTHALTVYLPLPAHLSSFVLLSL